MELKELRGKVDLIDAEILKLLNRRMELALSTRKLKDRTQDPGRETEVIDGIRKRSHSLMQPEFSEKLFRNIIEESRRIQDQNLPLAGFQGEHGAYSEVAARSYDKRFAPVPHVEFADVFKGVKSGQLDVGVVPVENSLEGAVTQVNDLLVETDLKIIAELQIPVHHCLLATPEIDYRDIKMVYSHPQALGQCRGFLTRNKLDPKPYYDTAGAALMLAEERPKAAAAIASKLCADLYNLEILKENIEDHGSNCTRFLVLAREKNTAKEKGNKCSIIFSTQHRAGALFSVLKVFSDASINLTRIESRPMRTDPGKFVFLLDFNGSDEDGLILNALDSLKKHTSMLKLLGCYKEARSL